MRKENKIKVLLLLTLVISTTIFFFIYISTTNNIGDSNRTNRSLACMYLVRGGSSTLLNKGLCNESEKIVVYGVSVSELGSGTQDVLSSHRLLLIQLSDSDNVTAGSLLRRFLGFNIVLSSRPSSLLITTVITAFTCYLSTQVTLHTLLSTWTWLLGRQPLSAEGLC